MWNYYITVTSWSKDTFTIFRVTVIQQIFSISKCLQYFLQYFGLEHTNMPVQVGLAHMPQDTGNCPRILLVYSTQQCIIIGSTRTLNAFSKVRIHMQLELLCNSMWNCNVNVNQHIHFLCHVKTVQNSLQYKAYPLPILLKLNQLGICLLRLYRHLKHFVNP